MTTHMLKLELPSLNASGSTVFNGLSDIILPKKEITHTLNRT